MRIKVHQCGEVADYIRHARSETIREMGRGPDSPDAAPLELARYFIAYAPCGTKIGMAEAYFHDQYFPDPATSPYGSVLDLHRFGPYERVCHIRTIFVEPAHRNGGHVFVQLYLAAAHVFLQMGALYSTCATAAHRHDLKRLYQRLGAHHLGELSVHSGSTSSGFLFDLHQLSRHSAAAMSIACLDADWETGVQEHRGREFVTEPLTT